MCENEKSERPSHVIGEYVHRHYDDPARCSAELGEASNRWKIYFDPTNEPLAKELIEMVRRLQDWAVETGAAPPPKPPKMRRTNGEETMP